MANRRQAFIVLQRRHLNHVAAGFGDEKIRAGHTDVGSEEFFTLHLARLVDQGTAFSLAVGEPKVTVMMQK